MPDLKAAFSVSLDEKYIIHPLHKLATLISPTCKYLTFVDAAERDEIYAQMRAKVDSLASTDETDVTDGRRRTMCHRLWKKSARNRADILSLTGGYVLSRNQLVLTTQ